MKNPIVLVVGGKEELVSHAPSIGRRRLVSTEVDREGSEEEEDADPMEA